MKLGYRTRRTTLHRWLAGCLSAVALAASATGTLSFTEMEGHRMSARLVSPDVIDPSVVAEEILARARGACAERIARLGRMSMYTLPTGHPEAGEGRHVLEQIVHCDAPAQPADILEEAAGSGALETPAPEGMSEADKARHIVAVRARMDRYLRHLEAEEYEAAWAMLAGPVRDLTGREGWTEAARGVWMDVGERVGGRIWRTTTFLDPPGAAPGVYVAVDYGFSYARLPFRCGYIIWVLEGDGEYRVLREEAGLIEQATAERMDSDRLRDVARSMHCFAA